MNKQIELMKVKVESFKKTDNFVLEYHIVHLLNDIKIYLAYEPTVTASEIKRRLIKDISHQIDMIHYEIEFYPDVSFKPLYTVALKELDSLKLMIKEQLV